MKSVVITALTLMLGASVASAQGDADKLKTVTPLTAQEGVSYAGVALPTEIAEMRNFRFTALGQPELTITSYRLLPPRPKRSSRLDSEPPIISRPTTVPTLAWESRAAAVFWSASNWALAAVDHEAST